MIQGRRWDDSSGELLKETPRRRSRLHHALSPAPRLVGASLRVGIPRVVLELIGCLARLAGIEMGGL